MTDMSDTFDLGAIFVPTSRARRLHAYLDKVWDYGWGAHHCMCGLVLGPPRSGKTHMVKRWAAKKMGLATYPERFVTVPPIVLAEVTPGCNTKTVCGDILEGLLDPNPNYGSQAVRVTRIKKAILPPEGDRGRQEVRTLILDEFHRLVNADTSFVKREVGSLITHLLSSRLCPMVLVGERTAERVFQGDDRDTQARGNTQLEGRSFGAFYLTPHRWADPEDRKEFRVFLHEIDKRLRMPELSNLGSIEMAIRIHNFSGGLLGQAARLIADARINALRDGYCSIAMEHFAGAVDDLRVGDTRKLVNPFRVDSPKSGDDEK